MWTFLSFTGRWPEWIPSPRRPVGVIGKVAERKETSSSSIPSPRYMPKGWFQQTAAVTRMVLREQSDLLSLDAIDAYFRLLYELDGGNLDEHNIIDKFEEGASRLEFPFREVGETFQLIDSPMTPVVIPRR